MKKGIREEEVMKECGKKAGSDEIVWERKRG